MNEIDVRRIVRQELSTMFGAILRQGKASNRRGNTSCDVDALALKRIVASDGRSMGDISRAAGLERTAISHIIRKGTCLDHVACAVADTLGVHPSEFVSDTYAIRGAS